MVARATWLRESESNWPSTAVAFNEEEMRNEVKMGVTVHMISLNKKSFKVSDYFSSYVKLIRFLARMHRFTDNCKSAIRKRKLRVKDSNPARIESQKTSLTYKEMQSAENKLLKYLQEQMLKAKLKEKLTSFKSIINDDGLLILKTKIVNREDDPKYLSPVILDNNHEVVYMLVREAHERLGHVGATVVMSHIREQFWIISLRRLIKRIESKCVICRRQKAKHADSETPPSPPRSRPRCGDI